MEQTALRPKPMPGREPGGGRPAPARRPHAARRRGRRLRALLFALFAGTVLVLSGAGLGTVGATVIGEGGLAELRRQAEQVATGDHDSPSAADPSPSALAGPAPAPGGAMLGLEAVDAKKAGALVVGVHVPGPGYTAGLVRGDVLLAFGRTPVDSAADLAHVVTRSRPGKEVVVTVRHRSGGYQRLTVVPGVVT
ncbi:PDZ domain-containing protein [Streptomyces sp. NPDC006332]|uniref:PDZ domain-containing protein n=1 Tax=Streptomyces sp. NPDC006332 TaxID=3155456 RepID=UPI0033BA8BC4